MAIPTVPTVYCPACGREVTATITNPTGTFCAECGADCPVCHGSGNGDTPDEWCSLCAGTGTVKPEEAAVFGELLLEALRTLPAAASVSFSPHGEDDPAHVHVFIHKGREQIIEVNTPMIALRSALARARDKGIWKGKE